jgi:hypothetical protein
MGTNDQVEEALRKAYPGQLDKGQGIPILDLPATLVDIHGNIRFFFFFLFLDQHFISRLYLLHVPRTLRSIYREEGVITARDKALQR